jgi:hypothetical protein
MSNHLSLFHAGVEHLPCRQGVSASAAECRTDRSEFALQNAGKGRQDRHHGGRDNAEEHDILGHGRPFLVVPERVEQSEQV